MSLRRPNVIFWIGFRAIVFGLFACVGGGTAWASGAIEAGVSPITIGAPSSAASTGGSSSSQSSSAFSGFGIEIQFDYYVNNSPWGLSVGALSEGGGTLEALRGRYYFVGHPQAAKPSSEEEKTATVVLEPKTRGAYVEAGLGIYQISQTVSSTTATGSQTQAGEGGILAIGFEQPLFSSFYVGFRATLFSSFGADSFNPVFGEVLFGVPFAF